MCNYLFIRSYCAVVVSGFTGHTEEVIVDFLDIFAVFERGRVFSADLFLADFGGVCLLETDVVADIRTLLLEGKWVKWNLRLMLDIWFKEFRYASDNRDRYQIWYNIRLCIEVKFIENTKHIFTVDL